MAFKIQYFRNRTWYAEVYWDEPLPETRETASKGLKRNQADFATILDLDRDAKVIETVSNPM